MKASIKQYAQGLYELVAGKSEKDAEKAIANFIELLNKNGDLGKADSIIDELNRLFSAEKGILSAVLVSARPLSAAAKGKISAFLMEKTGAEKIDLTEEIDQGIIGGFILRYEGYVIDGSVRNNLLKFKNHFSK